jgi:hypothetical protein
MKTIVTAALLVLSSAAMVAVFAEEYPRYYESITRDGYSVIAFHDSTNATYLCRVAREKDSAWFFFDDNATWGNYPKINGKTTRPSLWIRTTKFRFDFYMKGDTLVETDKAGPQRTYVRVQNDNKEAPNQAAEVTARKLAEPHR